MDIEQQIAEHYAVLGQVMADVAMDPVGEQATINQPKNFTRLGATYIPTREREALHDSWINQLIQESAKEAPICADRHVVVMAGAPGIGKGTIQRDELKRLPGFVACDPDKFKEKIIEHEHRNGTLAELGTPLMTQLKAQGHEFAPMEYSTLVHQESSMLSRQLQRQLQMEGKNYIIDTVLKDIDSARDVAARLDAQGYTYDVVSVQGTAAQSKAGIYGRWEGDYREYLEGKNELGGRPVPSEFANSTFPDPAGPSTTESAARWLAENGQGVVLFQQYRRGVEGPEIDLVKQRGKLVPNVSGAQVGSSTAGTVEKKSGGKNEQSFNADFPHAAGTVQQHTNIDKPMRPQNPTPKKDYGIER